MMNLSPTMYREAALLEGNSTRRYTAGISGSGSPSSASQAAAAPRRSLRGRHPETLRAKPFAGPEHQKFSRARRAHRFLMPEPTFVHGRPPQQAASPHGCAAGLLVPRAVLAALPLARLDAGDPRSGAPRTAGPLARPRGSRMLALSTRNRAYAPVRARAQEALACPAGLAAAAESTGGETAAAAHPARVALTPGWTRRA